VSKNQRSRPRLLQSSRSLTTLNGLDDAASVGVDNIPFPEIAAELGIPEREVLRWARARARGKTFRASANYRAYAIEVERRHRLIDYALFSSDDLYRDGIFKNARGAVA
jgi:hypothetical protein